MQIGAGIREEATVRLSVRLELYPYIYFNRLICEEVDRLTLDLSLRPEALGIISVPIPSDEPSVFWEAERSYARSVLSLRHARYLAGLGVPGRNTLLVNDGLGNMIQLGTLLLNEELCADTIADYQVCPEGCRLCIHPGVPTGCS